MTYREIVINDGPIAGGGEGATGMRANIAHTSRDENSQSVSHACLPRSQVNNYPSNCRQQEVREKHKQSEPEP
jgi:hypothetical protein